MKLLISAGGWAIRAAQSGMVVGVDKDTGTFSISANGCFFSFSPSTRTFDFVVGDNGTPSNNVLARLKLSPAGIELLASDPITTKKQTWTIAKDGSFTVLGAGAATLGWAGGLTLGLVLPPSLPKPLVVWDASSGLPLPSTNFQASG